MANTVTIEDLKAKLLDTDEDTTLDSKKPVRTKLVPRTVKHDNLAVRLNEAKGANVRL